MNKKTKIVTLGDVAKEEWLAQKLKKLGYSEKEIKQFQHTISCPRCESGFISFPDGWGWISHLAACERKKAKQQPEVTRKQNIKRLEE